MNAWSMKKDRDLIQMARAKLSIDRIATKLDTSQMSIIKAAKRLGIKIGLSPVKRDGRLKAKSS
jgi:hypothetical protein